jgi:hypothetical protein
MANLTSVAIPRAGVAVTTLPNSASASGDTYDNTGTQMPEFANSTGASITVYAAGYLDGQTVAQFRSWTIPANGRFRIGILPGTPYNDPATGRVNFTYSTHTGLTVGLYHVS